MLKIELSSRNWVLWGGIFAIVLLLNACNQRSQSTLSPAAALPTETVQSTPTEISADLVTETPAPASPTALSTKASTPTATLEPTSAPTPEVDNATTCEPTPADALGPFYVPGAPERASVGQGLVLSGVVRSRADCSVIEAAQIEFWLAGPDGEYGDAYRATTFSDAAGGYEFESNPPPPYSGRPPHIHLRVTANGYQPLVTQYYPADGQREGMFDLVLVPDPAALSSSTVPPPILFDVGWQDRSPFRPGLIETEQDSLEQLPGASVYHIDLQIANDMLNLQGREEVLYTNNEDEPLAEIYFRLFPNLADGATTVSSLKVNDLAVEPSYELRDSAMRVPLSPALQPGEQVVVQIEFAVKVPDGEGGNYGTFAYLNNVLALAHFYPIIAVYDDEGWNIEIAPSIGDVVYADTSFYLVRVTAPADQTVVASGIEIKRENTIDQQVVTFAAGPMRDFYLAASDRYTVASRTVGQTTLQSYAPAEFAAGIEIGLDQAEDALQSFNDRFGPYPYTEFDLVSTTTFALGVEYPGIVAILVDLYNPSGTVSGTPTSPLFEGTIAHEVAHQWFYGVVGNDQVDEPWLDEALVQFATLLYFSDVYGPSGANGFRSSLERRWNRVNGADIPIGLPVRAYTVNEYSAIVYGRGPLFIEALAETMGQDVFTEFLREYYQIFQWGIASGNDFKQLAERHCDCDLTPLFEAWVYDGTTTDD